MFGKFKATILVVNLNTEFVRILVNGVMYSCPMTKRGDTFVFRFRDKWYPVSKYTTDMTQYIG
jgi:hypothetical protein